ncbi:hypothetical protein Ssi02_55980 [Sinosporangium siamense]|uniref:DUF998 domain-containing protein n=2 Tax=Sinosporangium siamense TaxID=1367973 RepID=A0A919RLF5_9ACTN|nr:hypothetical protein Ssi02_55980 [Sinosporangium siamense]
MVADPGAGTTRGLHGSFTISPVRATQHTGFLAVMDSSHLTRKLVVAAHAGLAGSLVGATALHIGWAKQVDTVRHTVSDYALSENAAAVFAGTVASLSAGSAALLAGLVRSRLPIGAPATALLGVWCGGMALTGIFRTDPQGGVPTARGLTHRYAAGGAIATLPAVGLLIARRLQGMPGWERKARTLRRISWASAAGGLAFLATHLSATAARPTPAVRAIGGWLGLAERAALTLELSLLFQLAEAVHASREER